MPIVMECFFISDSHPNPASLYWEYSWKSSGGQNNKPRNGRLCLPFAEPCTRSGLIDQFVDVAEVAIGAGVVETVANDERIRDLEAGIGDGHVFDSS